MLGGMKFYQVFLFLLFFHSNVGGINCALDKVREMIEFTKQKKNGLNNFAGNEKCIFFPND